MTQGEEEPPGPHCWMQAGGCQRTMIISRVAGGRGGQQGVRTVRRANPPGERDTPAFPLQAHMYTHTHTHTHTCSHTHTSVLSDTLLCTYMYSEICVLLSTHEHTTTHIYNLLHVFPATHVCTYAYLHMHTLAHKHLCPDTPLWRTCACMHTDMHPHTQARTHVTTVHTPALLHNALLGTHVCTMPALAHTRLCSHVFLQL
jgi:hypothetical protein